MLNEFNKITSRHAAKAISHLNEINCPKCAIDAVRREFWYLKDDITEIINNVNKGISPNDYTKESSKIESNYKKSTEKNGNI